MPDAAEQRLRAHLRGCTACRDHYDRLALAAQALAPAGDARRARLRLERALAGQAAPAAPTPTPTSTSTSTSTSARARGWRWSPLFLAPAAAAALLLALFFRASPPAPDDQITWRGGAEPAASDIGLLVYAGRRADAGVASVRLAADLPGSGEAKLGLNEVVQFSVRGLRQAAYVTVVGVDDQGEVHVYVPRAETPPRPLMAGAAPQVLGPSIDLSVKHRVGRLRIFALATPSPGDAATIAAAVRQAGQSGKLALPFPQASGILTITP